MIAQFHTVTFPVTARVVFVALAFLVLLVFATPSVYAESWSVWEFHDEMDETITKGAVSALTTPTRALSSSHHELRGEAGFSCENALPSFYFWFSKTPDLSGNETLASLDGAEVLRTRVKFDHDDPMDIVLLRSWGNDTLFVVSYEPSGDNNSFLRWLNLGGDLNAPDIKWIERIINSSTMLLELSWPGLAKVFFRFDLEGSAEALREAGCFIE